MASLALRVQRYRALNADPRISCRTDFFAAAALVTWLVRRLAPSGFLCALSARLENFNVRRAAEIRAGYLYLPGSIAANTLDFVRVEQDIVQRELHDFAFSCPRSYRAEVAFINRALYCAGKLPQWCPAEACFRRALRSAQERGQCHADFASQAFRVSLGEQIASGLRKVTA